MKEVRLIFLAFALLAVLFAGGCARTPNPGPVEGGVISFQAGVELVREESSTKALNEATSFTNGQTFRVFGRRTGEGQNTRIFYRDDSEDPMENYQSVAVTKTDDVWTYSPPIYWYWVSERNYYDFIAVYPDDAPAVRMMDESVPPKDIPGNMAIKSEYNIASDTHDLLMAATRRVGLALDRTAPVELTFNHMLCAVKVVVSNESTSESLTLNELSLNNIIQSAYAKMTIDSKGEPEYYWIDSRRNETKVILFTGTETVLADGDYATSFKLLIPGDLTDTIDGSSDEDKMPHLNVVIDGFSSEDIPPIPLKDIQRSRYTTEDPITVWEPGIRYTYHIIVRLDGGVRVTVVTTEWDEIEAETPGLLIE